MCSSTSCDDYNNVCVGTVKNQKGWPQVCTSAFEPECTGAEDGNKGDEYVAVGWCGCTYTYNTTSGYCHPFPGDPPMANYFSLLKEFIKSGYNNDCSTARRFSWSCFKSNGWSQSKKDALLLA